MYWPLDYSARQNICFAFPRRASIIIICVWQQQKTAASAKYSWKQIRKLSIYIYQIFCDRFDLNVSFNIYKFSRFFPIDVPC